jgi:hypothetical protein
MTTLPFNQPDAPGAVPLTPPAAELHNSPPAARQPAGNLCPLCRLAMRLWAIDGRFAPTESMAMVCYRAAMAYRDACFHSDAQRYWALVKKLESIKGRTDLPARERYNRSLPIASAIEQVKNRHGGYHTRLEAA